MREEPGPQSPDIVQPQHRHHGWPVVAEEEEMEVAEEVLPAAEEVSAGVHTVGPQCPHCGSGAA